MTTEEKLQQTLKALWALRNSKIDWAYGVSAETKNLVEAALELGKVEYDYTIEPKISDFDSIPKETKSKLISAGLDSLESLIDFRFSFLSIKGFGIFNLEIVQKFLKSKMSLRRRQEALKFSLRNQSLSKKQIKDIDKEYASNVEIMSDIF